MNRIALINLPFASANLPSIALAQLRARLQEELGEAVETKIFHLNLEYAHELTSEIYDMIAGSVEAVTAGLGDWFFKLVAFPEMDDDPEAYLQRHFAEHKERLALFKGPLLEQRRQAERVLEGLIEKHGLDRFDLVGFTSMFSQNLACFAMARLLKRRNPKVVTVMGGANCETSMGEVIARHAEPIDYVFSGPSLINFPQFVSHLAAGETAKAAALKGVYAKTGGTGLRLAHAAPQVGEELDIEVDVPLDYDDFLAARAELLPNASDPAMIMFETSRGCWWGERSHCTFCGLNGMTMKYRGMSSDRALRLMRSLFERYADRVSHFQSVDNIMPREYLTEVFPQLETPDHVSIFYEVKADLKDHEMEVLARAGVTEIQPGIEAMNTSTLRLMRKGTTSFQNIRFLKSCLTHGIQPHWNLLVGFPDEPEEVYEKYVQDIPKLLHLPPPSGSFPVRFDRFSPYFKETEWGLKLQPCDFYRMVYPFPEEALERMAYFFIDTNYNAPYIHRTARWLGRLRNLVGQWRELWADADRSRTPQLTIRRRHDAEVVVDSRSGRTVEHEMDIQDLEILRQLQRHRKPDWLANRMEIDDAELDRRIRRLVDLDLLFEENGLYMSVVMDEPDPTDPALLKASSDAVERFSFQ